MAPFAIHSKPFARAALALTGLAWTLPFLQPYHRYPWTGFYSEWLAFALGLAAALLLLHRSSWRDGRWPTVALAPVALSAVLGLQAALGMVPYAGLALTAALYLLWAALTILLGQALRRESGMTAVATTLAWWLLGGGALVAAAGLLQHFQVGGIAGPFVAARTGSQVYGNLGQANHFAVYLAMALASALYLGARGRLAAGWTVACAALLLLAMAVSGSRSLWLYLGAFVVVAFLPRADGVAERRRLRLAALCLLPGFVAAHGLLSLVAALPPASTTVTSAARVLEVSAGTDSRFQLWKEAWQMFLDAPGLGAGLGQFAWHHFLHAAADLSIDPRVFRHAHNLVFQLLAETGAVGALIVIGALASWLAGLKWRALDLDGFWVLALLATLGLHSLLEFPLWYSYFLGMAALLLGIGSPHFVEWRRAGAGRAVIAIAIAAGCFNLASVWSSYREFERLVFLPAGGEARPADEQAFARAIAGLYREPMLVPYVEVAIAFGIPVNEDRLGDKLALARRAMHFAPVAAVVYRYALLLALAGEREAAADQFERSLRVYPRTGAGLVAELKALEHRYPGRFGQLLELAVNSPARPARLDAHD